MTYREASGQEEMTGSLDGMAKENSAEELDFIPKTPGSHEDVEQASIKVKPL